MDRERLKTLEEKARGPARLPAVLERVPELVYNQNDLVETAFIDDATDYYQVYDGRDGRLLTQSPRSSLSAALHAR
jgi:hypothetical protein